MTDIAYTGLALAGVGAAMLVAWPLTLLVHRTVAARAERVVRPVPYPIVAAATAVGFAAMALRFGLDWELPAYLFLVAVLVTLSFVDLSTRLLPRRIVHVALAGGVVLLAPVGAATGEPHRLWWAAAGVVGVYLVLSLLHLAGGFGFGDVRLGAMLGWYLAWQGPRYVPAGVFLAFLLSAIVGLVLMALGRAGRRTRIPFGPFLALGAVASLVGGPALFTG